MGARRGPKEGPNNGADFRGPDTAIPGRYGLADYGWPGPCVAGPKAAGFFDVIDIGTSFSFPFSFACPSFCRSYFMIFMFSCSGTKEKNVKKEKKKGKRHI